MERLTAEQVLAGYAADERNFARRDLTGADLRGADLREANFFGASLQGADLTGADLTRANLGQADLRGAKLTDARLDGAFLAGAILAGADLSGAGVTVMQEAQRQQAVAAVAAPPPYVAPPIVVAPLKAPALAGVLELVLPGAGLMYADQVARGVSILIGTYTAQFVLVCAAFTLTAAFERSPGAMTVVVGIIYLLLALGWAVYRIVQAAEAARSYNRRVQLAIRQRYGR